MPEQPVVDANGNVTEYGNGTMTDHQDLEKVFVQSLMKQQKEMMALLEILKQKKKLNSVMNGIWGINPVVNLGSIK